jgi:PAS domain S-box-containing protein
LRAWDIEASPVIGVGDRWRAHVATATQSDQPLMIEGVHRRKDGSKFPAEVCVSYREFEDQAYLLVTARDVTERHLIHEALRSEHESLRALIRAIPDLVYFKDLGRRNMLVNKAYEKFAGRSADQIMGKLDEELFPMNMAMKCRASDEQVLRTGHASQVETIVPDNQGQEIVFDTIKTPIRGADGRIVGLVGVSRDITQRKLEEQRLQDAKQRYHTLVEQLPVGVVVVDAETTLPIEFNNQAAVMLGYTRQEFARLRVVDYEANENPREVKAHLSRILEQGHDDFVTKMRAKDGTIKNIRVSIRVMELDGRRVFHNVFSEIVRDKTGVSQVTSSMIEPSRAVELGEQGQEAQPAETTAQRVEIDPC